MAIINPDIYSTTDLTQVPNRYSFYPLDPVADFTFSVNNLILTVEDTSYHPIPSEYTFISREWDFNDDDIGDSTDAIAMYTILENELYPIKLTITYLDKFGVQKTKSVTKTIISLGVSWETTQTGLISTGGWKLSNNGRTIKFDIEDSLNCGGSNDNIQEGIAVATIETGPFSYKFNPIFTGFGEAQDDNFERMELLLNDVLIIKSESTGGSLGCLQSVPVVQTIIIPGPYLLNPYTTTTFELNFTTGDNLYHIDAFYQLDLTFERV